MLGEALSYLGDSIDKPGRAVRGLLSGNLREGLAAVPFSDSLGITDPKQRVSGRNLTDKMGLTRTGDKGWGSWIAGTAAESALDPLSYLPAHSVFKGLKMGQAAEHGLTAPPVRNNLREMIQPALGLKYDNLHVPPAGMPRNAPEWVNNKTFYHGSGTSGLTGDVLDPMKTSPFNLKGRGIYTTEAEDIGRSYIPKGARQGSRDFAQSLYEDTNLYGKTNDMARSGHFDDVLGRYSQATGEHAPLDPIQRAELVRRLATEHFYGMHDPLHPVHAIARDVANLVSPNFRRDAGALYQAQSGFGNILDLDQKMHPKDYGDLYDAMDGAYRFHPKPGAESLADALKSHYVLPSGQPKSPDELIEAMATVRHPVGPDAMTHQLRELGYDALTHSSSGSRTRGGVPHQVVIGLDPNDVLGLGSKSPYQRWEPLNASINSAAGSGSLTSGNSLSGSLGSLPGSGGTSGGGLSTRLRSLREGIPVFHAGDRPRVVGGHGWSREDLSAAAAEHVDIKREVDGLQGVSVAPWYKHATPAAGTAAVWEPSATREEILHAMTARAVHDGRIGDLPYLAQPAAYLHQAANTTGSRSMRGYASILDELSAQTLAQRGLKNRLGAAGNFLLNPADHLAYDPQFAAHGLAPRLAYHTLPYALPVGVGAGAGYALSNGE